MTRLLPNLVCGMILSGLLVSVCGAQDEPRDITGKWVGTAINHAGEKTDDFLVIREQPDGTLTGEWHVKDMVIEKGERISSTLLYWESTLGEGRYRVRCKQLGKALVLEWTYSEKTDGKVKGGTGVTVLVRE